MSNTMLIVIMLVEELIIFLAERKGKFAKAIASEIVGAIGLALCVWVFPLMGTPKVVTDLLMAFFCCRILTGSIFCIAERTKKKEEE